MRHGRSETIELFSKRRFKFSNLDDGNTLTVPVVRSVDVSDFGDLTAVLRVHSATLDTDSSVDVIFKSTSPSCEDPSADFVDSTPLSTLSLVTGAAAGDLEIASLPTAYGSHLEVSVKGTQATVAGTLDVTLSCELVAREHARPARLSDTAPQDTTKATASAGTSAESARADHKHDISTAAASSITDSSNGEGSATSLARSDHTHAHGSRGGGSLHDAATTSVAGFLSAADKTWLDSLPMTPSAITSTTSAATTPTLYLCSPSSSNINVNLPAASGNSGLRIGVKMVDSNSDTRTVTIDGNSTETIDGQTTVVLYTDGDYLEIECDGSGWHVVVDGRIAHRCILRRSTGQSIPHNTTTSIDFSNEVEDVGGIAATGTAPNVTIRRTGYYLVSCSINLTGPDDGEKVTLRFVRSGSFMNFVNIYSPGTNNELAVSLTALVKISSGQTIDMRVYHNEGSSLSTSTVNEDEPRMSIVEVMPTLVP